jgi:DNA-binding NarL/FixJ family response regulator
MKRVENNGFKPVGLVWIDCPYSVVVTGLLQVLESEWQVHVGQEPPKKGEDPSCVVFCADETEDLWESVQRFQRYYPAAPVIAFGLRLELALAWAALRAGARGFIHAEMPPEQMLRAVRVALRGEIAAPRNLLDYIVASENSVRLDALSARQREILGLVDKGLSNAHIAERLFLSESTVKHHLRLCYKILGASNRTEATSRLVGVKMPKPSHHRHRS